ncbi:MAG: hypothetical protein ACRDNL_09700 [Spirillospora sp.]
MSESRIRKYGPQVQMHLLDGERLIEVVFALALRSAPKGTQSGHGPIVGTGNIAGQLLNDMPARAAGLICITDRRVLFFSTGLKKVKRLWWHIPRETVNEIVPGQLMFALQFTDGTQAWFGGGGPDHESLARALGLAT